MTEAPIKMAEGSNPDLNENSPATTAVRRSLRHPRTPLPHHNLGTPLTPLSSTFAGSHHQRYFLCGETTLSGDRHRH
ncbi:hypothetical protein Dimus_026006 [Dionaea muscipula]